MESTAHGNVIKVAIVGYGFSAKIFHLPFINTLPEFELSAISSRQISVINHDYPEVSHYLTAEDMICNILYVYTKNKY